MTNLCGQFNITRLFNINILRDILCKCSEGNPIDQKLKVMQLKICSHIAWIGCSNHKLLKPTRIESFSKFSTLSHEGIYKLQSRA